MPPRKYPRRRQARGSETCNSASPSPAKRGRPANKRQVHQQTQEDSHDEQVVITNQPEDICSVNVTDHVPAEGDTGTGTPSTAGGDDENPDHPPDAAVEDVRPIIIRGNTNTVIKARGLVITMNQQEEAGGPSTAEIVFQALVYAATATMLLVVLMADPVLHVRVGAVSFAGVVVCVAWYRWSCVYAGNDSCIATTIQWTEDE